jgi:hypothetical protein
MITLVVNRGPVKCGPLNSPTNTDNDNNMHPKPGRCKNRLSIFVGIG